MFKHSVFRNASALMIMQLLGYVSPFLVYPYLTRVLGVSGFGQYAIALSITAVTLIVTDFGFALSGANWLAKNKDNIDKVNSYISDVLLVKTILFIACSLGVIFLVVLNPNLNYLQNVLISILFLLWSQTYQASWLFQGLEKMSLAVYPFILSRVVFIFTVYLFVNEKKDIDVAIFLQGFSNILSVFISGMLLFKQGLRLVMPAVGRSLTIFRENISFFISRASVSIYTSASTFILGYASSVHSAAYYSAAEKLYMAGQSLTSTVSQALYPYLARTGNKKVLFISVIIVIVPLIFGVTIASYFSTFFITLIYGDLFLESAKILNVFLMCLVINFVGVSFGYPAFSIINRVDVANKSVYAGAVIQLFLLGYLYSIDNITPLTVVYSVLMTETCVMGLRIYFFFRLSNKKQKL
ncbi:oligosaccharide flippase family protein [Citrobacter portucalensis]|uniref:oligosaccharide flippase family protein n=1 Tax=Citrobacter portucalensis TaxID=1639133 RepID=UPI0015EA6BD3|nr:oligosaccharide flippase family protein [Citrobacter portucalensis]MBA8420587.1 oligosaccharide flippase family protein [Citrobacter freundii]MDE9614009.1 oligosaccharide flippase family protein [Citrobacter portucalensis]QMM94530.1 oligosaccharide flippase family protein [Citrobacter freundii]WFZ26236.1 oligosaccharide flippase family protein [Citrobacter portucalensis]